MYQVILIGVREDVAKSEAVKNLAVLFKTTPEQVEKLLGISSYVVKKGIPEDVARQYKAAIDATGATCRMEQEVTLLQTLDVDLPQSPTQDEEFSPENAHDALDGTQKSAFKIQSWMYVVFGVVLVLIVGAIMSSSIVSKLVNVSGKQPTSGTWKCDNASQNYRPWEIWTLSSDGSYIYNIEGIRGSGHYVWENAEHLKITDDDPPLNQTWTIIQANDDGWLMSNGRFEVYCHQ